MTSNIEGIEKLVGEKITVWKSGDMGFGWTMKGTLNSVHVGQYAQHENAIFITMTPYRARNRKSIVLFGQYTEFLLWEGHHTVNTEIYNSTPVHENNGVQMFKGEASSHSNHWKAKAKNSVKQSPAFEI